MLVVRDFSFRRMMERNIDVFHHLRWVPQCPLTSDMANRVFRLTLKNTSSDHLQETRIPTSVTRQAYIVMSNRPTISSQSFDGRRKNVLNENDVLNKLIAKCFCLPKIIIFPFFPISILIQMSIFINGR